MENLWTQVVFSLASLITLLALSSKDMLVLQILFLTANCLFLITSLFFYIPVMIFMNLCYVAMNLYRIICIYIERKAITLPIELRPVYYNIFNSMRPRQFLKFSKTARRITLKKGKFLCREGEESNFLICVIAGSVAIQKNDQMISTLSGQFFIGEMRYLTRNPMSADVVAINEVTFLQWRFEQIDDLKKNDQHMYLKLSEILGRDLISKIQGNTKIINSHKANDANLI